MRNANTLFAEWRETCGTANHEEESNIRATTSVKYGLVMAPVAHSYKGTNGHLCKGSNNKALPCWIFTPLVKPGCRHAVIGKYGFAHAVLGRKLEHVCVSKCPKKNTELTSCSMFCMCRCQAATRLETTESEQHVGPRCKTLSPNGETNAELENARNKKYNTSHRF
jgi:hypothetical protein